jgi:hypothetical protein
MERSKGYAHTCFHGMQLATQPKASFLAFISLSKQTEPLHQMGMWPASCPSNIPSQWSVQTHVYMLHPEHDPSRTRIFHKSLCPHNRTSQCRPSKFYTIQKKRHGHDVFCISYTFKILSRNKDRTRPAQKWIDMSDTVLFKHDPSFFFRCRRRKNNMRSRRN